MEQKDKAVALKNLQRGEYEKLFSRTVSVFDHKSERLLYHLRTRVPALRDDCSECENVDSEVLNRLHAFSLTKALDLTESASVSPENRERLLQNLSEVPGIDLGAGSENQYSESQREYAFMVSPLRWM